MEHSNDPLPPVPEAEVQAFMDGALADAVLIADLLEHWPDHRYDAPTIRRLAALEPPRVVFDDGGYPWTPRERYDREDGKIHFRRAGGGPVHTRRIAHALLDLLWQGWGDAPSSIDAPYRTIYRLLLGCTWADEAEARLEEVGRQEARRKRKDRCTHWVTDMKANGSFRFTDGSVRHPDGRMDYADGRTEYPDGRWRYKDGSIEHPDGLVEYPDGSSGYPYGHFHPADAR